MAELSRDNPYPFMMYHAVKAPTLAMDEKQRDILGRDGYQSGYIHKEYPKHVPTGKFITVKNADGGTTDLVETVIVADAGAEDALLKRWAKEKADKEAQEKIVAETAEAQREKRGPGRPPKEQAAP